MSYKKISFVILGLIFLTAVAVVLTRSLFDSSKVDAPFRSTQNSLIEITHSVSGEDFKCPSCSIIFLNIELLRADHTGLIGNKDLTPAMDRFFADDMIFYDMSAPAGETFLSNTAVLTGVHPLQFDITGLAIDKYDQLESDEQDRIRNALTSVVSWPETLSANGYHTININQGRRAGENVFLDRGFEEYSQWQDEVLFEDMVDVVIETLKSNANKPYFLLFRPTFLHNYQYRNSEIPDSVKKLKIKANHYSYTSPEGTERKGVLMKRNRSVSKSEQRLMDRSLYRAQLDYGDRHLSRLFKFLDAEFSDNSIIVLYANHGSGLGDNDTFNHGTSYQASVHVPLLISHPNVPGPIHIRSPLALFDLVPTISNMVGVKNAEWSAIEHYDKTILRDGPVKDSIIVGKNSWDEYIRKGEWKLVIKFGRIKSLFNVKDDPNEEHDISDYQQDKLVELELLLAEYKNQIKINIGN